MVKMHFYTRLFGKPCKHISGKLAKVYIGANLHIGGSNRLVFITPFHNKRHPVFYCLLAGSKLHTLKYWVFLKRFKPCLKEVYIILTPNKAHMRNTPYKILRFCNKPFFNKISPELF